MIRVHSVFLLRMTSPAQISILRSPILSRFPVRLPQVYIHGARFHESV